MQGADLGHLVIAMMDDYVVPAGDGGFEHCPADAHYSCRRFAREEITGPLNEAAAVGVPDEHVWRGIRSSEELDNALATIRRRKLARSHSPEHVVGLAVPVWREDRVIASVSVYLPEVRFTTQRRKEIVSALRNAGEEISRQLKPERT